jgi:hypothetical protein
MGPEISQEEIREKRWSRELSKVFGCAKIADPLPFLPKFLASFILSSRTIIYFLCSPDGALRALSHDHLTLLETFSAQLPASPLSSLTRLTENSALLIGDSTVFAIVGQEESFSITPFKIENPAFVLPIPGGNSFAVVCVIRPLSCVKPMEPLHQYGDHRALALRVPSFLSVISPCSRYLRMLPLSSDWFEKDHS